MSLETEYQLPEDFHFFGKELYLVVNGIVRRKYEEKSIISFKEMDLGTPILWNAAITLFMYGGERVMVVIDLNGSEVKMWAASITKTLSCGEEIELTEDEISDAVERTLHFRN